MLQGLNLHPESMEAVILAGGRGRRLRPVTDHVPKPLIPIKNIPIIERQITYLQKFGVKKVIICTGYKSEQIKDYLQARGGLVETVFSIESSPLGTGGAIKNASSHIHGKTFFVINGDIITDINLEQMKKTTNSIATIPLRTKYGTIQLDDNKITGFAEKANVPGAFMNAGIYHLSRDILDDLPIIGDIERTVFPEYANTNRLFCVRFTDPIWHSIDSFKDLEECADCMPADT